MTDRVNVATSLVVRLRVAPLAVAAAVGDAVAAIDATPVKEGRVVAAALVVAVPPPHTARSGKDGAQRGTTHAGQPSGSDDVAKGDADGAADALAEPVIELVNAALAIADADAEPLALLDTLPATRIQGAQTSRVDNCHGDDVAGGDMRAVCVEVDSGDVVRAVAK